jgi:hypothetical protein
MPLANAVIINQPHIRLMQSLSNFLVANHADLTL